MWLCPRKDRPSHQAALRRAAPGPVTRGHTTAPQPLTRLQRFKEGSLPCPPQGPSGLKGSLEHGIVGLPGPPEAHKPVPHPLTSAHTPATALSQPGHRPSHGADHRDLRPIWPCPRSPPPALWGKSFRTVLPAGFPEPHLPCAASLPTTDSFVNYLYPSHQLLRAPGRRLSAAGLTGTAGRGLARSRCAGWSWASAPFLYCSVTLGRSLNLSEPPLYKVIMRIKYNKVCEVPGTFLFVVQGRAELTYP